MAFLWCNSLVWINFKRELTWSRQKAYHICEVENKTIDQSMEIEWPKDLQIFGVALRVGQPSPCNKKKQNIQKVFVLILCLQHFFLLLHVSCQLLVLLFMSREEVEQNFLGKQLSTWRSVGNLWIIAWEGWDLQWVC